jgi:hypothetical protein
VKKRFIVAVESGTKEQQDAFTEYLRGQGFGWWHWIDNLWLLVDSTGKTTGSDLTSQVNATFPTLNCMVFELSADGDTWAGYGPRTEASNMFTWMRQNWKE